MSVILYNGSIFGQPHADALLVEGQKVVHLGNLRECQKLARKSPELIDLKGRMLLPAFTDAHTHFVEYAKSRILVNLQDCHSVREMREYLRRYKAELKWDAAWILGGGWENRFADSLNRQFLDLIWPNTPVALFSGDYHAKLCNSKALEIAGITANTLNPEGGLIQKDAMGEPTGILYESATLLLEPFIQPPPDEMIVSAIRESVQDMYRYGLTGFHTMESIASRDLLRSAQAAGSHFRFVWYFLNEDFERVQANKAYYVAGDNWYQLGGLKLFGDGTLGSRTAALLNPYPLEPDNNGILRYSDSELNQLVQQAADAGFGVSIHTIGDAAIRQALDAAKRYRQNGNKPPLRLRLEHLQLIDKEDIARLKELEIEVSMQPLHLAGDIALFSEYYLDTHGAYLFKTLLDSGVPLSFGSDAPIVSLNPFWGIYIATQRKAWLKPDNPAFCPRECLSPEEAIRAYTQQSPSPNTLQKGVLADLFVIEDYRKLPPEYWLEAQSLLTMIDGEIVHNAL